MAAYTPTVWVNNVPPAMSAANLNKLTDELEAQATLAGVTHSLPTWADGVAPAITDAAPLNEMERVLGLVAAEAGLSYTGTTWSNGWTPARNAARLNQMEQQAVANRSALEATPTVGDLTYRPPHYVGGDPRLITSYTGLTLAPAPSFAANVGYSYNLSNGVDYFLDLGLKEWNTYNFGPGDQRTGVRIYGGRDVVIVGGEILAHSTNIYDDCAGLQVVGGDTTGTVYVEGVKITSVNTVTWSTQRTGIFQHCYLYARTFEDKDDPGRGGDGNHPDLFQIWDGSYGAQVFMDRVTGYTWYTGMTMLTVGTGPNGQLSRWRRNRVDVHHGTRLGETQQMGNYMHYLSGGNEQITCYYDGGTDNWMDLGYWGGIRNQLQMALDSPGWSWHLTYMVNHGGVDYGPTSDPNYFHTGAGPRDVGNTQGDEWRCTSNARVTERWKWGIAPSGTGAVNGNFAPAAACGTGYVPVGYA